MEDKKALLKEQLSDQHWRLNHLYKIHDKEGKVVTFVMNEAQEKLYHNQWYNNVILKARQLGFSTFIDILALDTALFNDNFKAGIIAHNREAANAIFDSKIKFPYDSLPAQIRGKVRSVTDRAGEIKFSNGSSIRVGTSFRSGTLQLLHVSELGKISALYPERAREIQTGAMESVAQGQQIFIESTAEGRSGLFYSTCKTAKDLQDSKTKLGEMDYKFHFFPWWENPDYHTDPSVTIWTTEDLRYFKDLENRNIQLTEAQQAWWIKKNLALGEDIYREHPSYPEEAFKASVIGAYYGQTITTLRRQGRIGDVQHDDMLEVFTSWDLGMNDDTCIWFFQVYGREIRLIDYEEHSGEGSSFYARLLQNKPYRYAEHYLPHDVSVREQGTGVSRKRTLENLGVHPICKVDRPRNSDQLLDQIDKVRSFLRTVWIDEAKCSRGLKALENYKKKWDEKLGTFLNRPDHGWASHGADALRTGAVGFNFDRVNGDDEDYSPEHTPDY